MTEKRLNEILVWWPQFLSCLDYKVFYWPGNSNEKVDASTMWPGDLPEGGDERLENVEQMVQKVQTLLEQFYLLADCWPTQSYPSGSNFSTDGYKTDQVSGEILEAIWTNRGLKELTIAECMQQSGPIQYRGKSYVPDDRQLWLWSIQNRYHSLLAGYSQQCKVYQPPGSKVSLEWTAKWCQSEHSELPSLPQVQEIMPFDVWSPSTVTSTRVPVWWYFNGCFSSITRVWRVWRNQGDNG